MTLKDAAWLKRPELPERDYLFSTVLPHATESKRRINYTTIAAILVALMYGLCWLLFR